VDPVEVRGLEEVEVEAEVLRESVVVRDGGEWEDCFLTVGSKAGFKLFDEGGEALSVDC